MIVDDDPMIRTVFAEQINRQPRIAVAATAPDGQAALDLLGRERDKLQIDVALIDVDMPILDGSRTALEIRRLYPDITVVMLTVFASESSFAEILAQGVRGFITKDEVAADVAAALVRASRGDPVMSSRPMELLVDAYRAQERQRVLDSHIRATIDQLPVHLRNVYGCLIKGHTNRRISQQLELSENTTRIYVSELLRRLGYSSRTELMAAHLRP
ncbi:response regulator transcription factor [Actinomyces ruminis]|nr:response regulator transcription factor [Actinomyces ruminis]